MSDDSTDTSKATKEIAIALSSEPDGPQRVMRVRGDEEGPKEASLGYVLPVEDGKPIPPGADLVEFKGRGDGSPVMDCRTVYESPLKPKGRGAWKPMSVSRETFESNWDRIFGPKPDKSMMN